MEKEQSARQQKISRVLQQEIAALLHEALRMGAVKNLLVSVTKVRVTSDLSIAKVYLSIFPAEEAQSTINALITNRLTKLYSQADDQSPVIAVAEQGVLMELQTCGVKWCRIANDDLRAFVHRDDIWGILENETLD